MSITALHFPFGESPLAAVTVDEREATSYYPYVQGGPVEAGYLTIQGVDLVVYVNSHYAEFDEDMINPRATALFERAGVGMFGGAVRGDALVVFGAGNGDYQRSVPPEVISLFMNSDSGPDAGNTDPTIEHALEEEAEELGDLHPVAVKLFDTGHGGSELGWAKHAWASLSMARLVQYKTEIERARVVCRLLALAWIAREFNVRAHGEGVSGEPPSALEEIVGDYAGIDPFVLGQLAERDGVDADIEVGWEFDEGSAATYALRQLVLNQMTGVAGALRSAWGDTLVFANLWASRNNETVYPLALDVLWDIVNTDVTGNKMEGWQWVEQGLLIG